MSDWHKTEWAIRRAGEDDKWDFESVPDDLLRALIHGVDQRVFPRWDYLYSPLLELQARRAADKPDSEKSHD